jgi:glycosyltransferase involved in cell wall biosynthesis
MKPDVAFFLPSLSGGGAEHAMISLAEEFFERGVSVDVVVAQAVGPHLQRAQRVARVVDLEASRILRTPLRLARYLRTERPSALLSSLPHANIVAVAARRLSGTSVRLVLREGNDLFADASASRVIRTRLTPLAARVTYPHCDLVIVNSQAMAQRLRSWRGLASGRVRVISNPLATSRIMELAARESPHEWFDPNSPPVLLSVGRLEPQKDVATLLRALARVRTQRPVRLVILGQGSQRSNLEALAIELGVQAEVALPGFVENPYAWMSRASALVLSSRWEGSPNVLVEALFLGLPIVSTDCAGARELLSEGELGRLTPPGDDEAMADAIVNTLDSPGDGSKMTASVRKNRVGDIAEQFLDALRVIPPARHEPEAAPHFNGRERIT